MARRADLHRGTIVRNISDSKWILPLDDLPQLEALELAGLSKCPKLENLAEL